MASFYNPLGEGWTIEDAITWFIWFLLGFVGLLTLLGIIYGGIRIITALGNQSAVEQGKKIIFWSIAGFAVIALAAVIVGIVSEAIGVT